jgi:O-antigen ligase
LKEGWFNIKKNWLFGVSPYGGSMLERERTQRHKDTYFHNAYIEMWIAYGLLGIILFISFYILSIRLGYELFFKYKNWYGLVIGTFLICQITKNVVWDTFISQRNLTVIYIFLISIAIRMRYMLKNQKTPAKSA